MSSYELLGNAGTTVGAILAVMGVVAAIESLIPLHPRGQWNRMHLRPNLALTALTFTTSFAFNSALVLMLERLRPAGLGLLGSIHLGAAPSALVAVLGLDLTFYAAHFTMHKVSWLWRFHSVHHSDPVVDVTTTVRQHPGESVLRYVFMVTGALALGTSPAEFAVYRIWSALAGLLEHANVRLPLWLDSGLALVISSPNFHKVHHSRAREHTDRNFGNCFSLFDRLFGTCTAAKEGTAVVCGLDGFDDPSVQTTGGLLALPFRGGEPFGNRAVIGRTDVAPSAASAR